jgi:hypothetical protein
MKMHELIGLKILDIDINDSKEKVKFTTDKGKVVYTVWGAYGREAWISSTEDLHNLFNREVLKVTGDDYDVTLWTEKGTATFSCRAEWGYEAGFSCTKNETKEDDDEDWY